MLTANDTMTSMTCPGTTESVPAARRWVRRALSGSPRQDDLELIASELVTNAIRHSRSGQAGGMLTVVIWCRHRWARLEVVDMGSAGTSPRRQAGGSDLATECGRGLAIVSALAHICGHSIRSSGELVAWADVAW